MFAVVGSDRLVRPNCERVVDWLAAKVKSAQSALTQCTDHMGVSTSATFVTSLSPLPSTLLTTSGLHKCDSCSATQLICNTCHCCMCACVNVHVRGLCAVFSL